MIAWLGMYDVPALTEPHDRYWQAIRARLGRGPARLTRTGDVWDIWQSADLLVAQTCGLPYRARLHDRVQLLGTPDYGLEGCPPGHYNSVLVVRRDNPADVATDLAGGTFAYNEPLSQSGWAAPVAHFGGQLPFARTLQTGAHAASAAAVADGRADIAALDALTWLLLQEHDPFAANLRVLERTVPTPTLPYITAPGQDAPAIATAIADAIDALPAPDRAALHLRGLIRIPAERYLSIPIPPPPPNPG